ncbi:26_t:CDS:10 [Paraglomus brasilianum]|uniref:26_t:CDS:1 n=1 Tax=Paraglomus brasilianum TaxID=144538 RepID=A0A9N9EZR8_9GLOM|nr:26_t:CDS:10 [Paraglomus brasilianum]
MKVNEYGIETADFENEKGKALDWCRDYFGERSEPRNSEIYKKERIRMQEVFRELKFNRLADIDEVVAEDSGESSDETSFQLVIKGSLLLALRSKDINDKRMFYNSLKFFCDIKQKAIRADSPSKAVDEMMKSETVGYNSEGEDDNEYENEKDDDHKRADDLIEDLVNKCKRHEEDICALQDTIDQRTKEFKSYITKFRELDRETKDLAESLLLSRTRSVESTSTAFENADRISANMSTKLKDLQLRIETGKTTLQKRQQSLGAMQKEVEKRKKKAKDLAMYKMILGGHLIIMVDTKSRFPYPPKKRPQNPREAQALYESIRTMALWLDSIPYIPFPIGIDAIIGVIPGVGDLAGFFLGCYQIHLISFFPNFPQILLAKMIGLVIVDAFVGLIPWIGDALDLLFKANIQNLFMLEKWLEEKYGDDICIYDSVTHEPMKPKNDPPQTRKSRNKRLPPYTNTGYNSNETPGKDVFFNAIALRYGHTEIETSHLSDKTYVTDSFTVRLDLLLWVGLAPILRSMASQQTRRVDASVSDEMKTWTGVNKLKYEVAAFDVSRGSPADIL